MLAAVPVTPSECCITTISSFISAPATPPTPTIRANIIVVLDPHNLAGPECPPHLRAQLVLRVVLFHDLSTVCATRLLAATRTTGPSMTAPCAAACASAARATPGRTTACSTAGCCRHAPGTIELVQLAGPVVAMITARAPTAGRRGRAARRPAPSARAGATRYWGWR